MGSIERDFADGWGIESSGLSARVVNCCKREACKTVGDLRRMSEFALMNWRSLGVNSIEEIRRFFKLCDSLEKGDGYFTTLEGLLDFFLNEAEYGVLMARYGLKLKKAAPSRHSFTLQQLADERDLTRERVRQVQDLALNKLSCKLAACFLRPFNSQVLGIIEDHAGIISCETAAEIDCACFDGLNSCSALLLMSDIAGAGFEFHNGFFSTWSRSDVDSFVKETISRLEHFDRPVSPEEISSKYGVDELVAALRGSSNILITKNFDLICSDLSFLCFVEGLLPEGNKRFHYRELKSQANEVLDPSTRKGSGFYLRRLQSSGFFNREGSGIYSIAKT